jgi:hypothetical protein
LTCGCPDGTFESNGECFACHPACDTCNGPSLYSCISCNDANSDLFEDSLLGTTCRCKSGFNTAQDGSCYSG